MGMGGTGGQVLGGGYGPEFVRGARAVLGCLAVSELSVESETKPYQAPGPTLRYTQPSGIATVCGGAIGRVAVCHVLSGIK
jgi:hypothetical protein